MTSPSDEGSMAVRLVQDHLEDPGAPLSLVVLRDVRPRPFLGDARRCSWQVDCTMSPLGKKGTRGRVLNACSLLILKPF